MKVSQLTGCMTATVREHTLHELMEKMGQVATLPDAMHLRWNLMDAGYGEMLTEEIPEAAWLKAMEKGPRL